MLCVCSWFSDAPPSQDFVVVKLDIDNTPIEEAVIKEIMTDSEAVARVDELMFGTGTSRLLSSPPSSTYRPLRPSQSTTITPSIVPPSGGWA